MFIQCANGLGDRLNHLTADGVDELKIELSDPINAVPDALTSYGLELADDGASLVYTYDTRGERTGIRTLLNDLSDAGLRMVDLQTAQSSLEDIFVGMVKETA